MSKTSTGPESTEAGALGLFFSLPFSSSCSLVEAGALGSKGAHAL